MPAQLHVTCTKPAVLQSVRAPQTVQYGEKDMVIQKAVATDKSGAMSVTFYSQSVDKVGERKSYILTNLKIHSYQNERYFKTTSNSTNVLLEEAILEAQFVDDVIYENVIKSAKICSVDMKSFETTVKCPTCNAVMTDASGDDDIVMCEACGSISTDCTSTSLTNI